MAQSVLRGGLGRAAVVGTVLQVGMVVLGHWVPQVMAAFAMGGMTISLVAGALFGFWVRPSGRGLAAGGGALAGGACAAIGIAVSVVLGDVPPTLLLVGTTASVVTGAIGGLFGRLFAVRPSAAS